MNQNNDTQDSQTFVWIVLLIIVLLIIPTVYAANIGSINGALLGLAKIQLKPFVPFFEEAQIALERINQSNPASLTWEQMQKVLRYTGTWLRFPCVLLLALLGTVSLFMGRISKLTRHLDMQKLLTHNADSFACLRPIVDKGKYFLSPKSYDTGLWRIARSPVQFAVEHGLLFNDKGKVFASKDILRNGLSYSDTKGYGQAYFDEEKTTKVLQKQLGNAFKNYVALSPHRKALASAFLAYASGDKKTCMDILDALSTSYTEIDTTPKCPISEQDEFQNTTLGIWKKNESLLKDKLMQRHMSFELTWFMALLILARRKGVLASSQFIWLRPLDRSLWYALNQCGGRVAWTEAVAAWAHYVAEEKAGKTLRKSNMNQAVLRFKETLSQSGLLAKEAEDILSSGSSIQGDVIFTLPEPDSEYDANTDPTLTVEYY